MFKISTVKKFQPNFLKPKKEEYKRKKGIMKGNQTNIIGEWYQDVENLKSSKLISTPQSIVHTFIHHSFNIYLKQRANLNVTSPK